MSAKVGVGVGEGVGVNVGVGAADGAAAGEGAVMGTATPVAGGVGAGALLAHDSVNGTSAASRIRMPPKVLGAISKSLT